MASRTSFDSGGDEDGRKTVLGDQADRTAQRCSGRRRSHLQEAQSETTTSVLVHGLALITTFAEVPIYLVRFTFGWLAGDLGHSRSLGGVRGRARVGVRCWVRCFGRFCHFSVGQNAICEPDPPLLTGQRTCKIPRV